MTSGMEEKRGGVKNFIIVITCGYMYTCEATRKIIYTFIPNPFSSVKRGIPKSF